ncbi:DegT/DnrJ/EryC1/StrS aminotransferase family protein [Planktomarina temperata]|nr:DegT/DnrJ/EryC1/StrS aminotransferase family protein [Planktomarina temperata]
MLENSFIPQFEPLFGIEEKEAVNNYMDNVGFITEFKLTQQFENRLAEFTGAQHCIVVNNGTISLTLASLALGLKPGDTVLVPNYTMVATPNSQMLAGIEPIFCDVEPDTLCIDLTDASRRIQKSTKAIIFVSANGRLPADHYDSVKLFAEKHELFLIEDAAQSLGSTINGKNIGTFGDVGSISFSAPKIISTGQGGALLTDNDDIAAMIRKKKDFGRSSGGNDIHDEIGFNFKFTELQAAVGLAQLEKLSDRVIRKKDIFKQYQEYLNDCNQVSLYHNDCDITAPWFIDIMCENRDQLAQFLKNNGIGTRVMYPPINRQKAYSQHFQHFEDFPVSSAVGKFGLWLPSSVQLENRQIKYICSKIKDFYSAGN